MKKILALSLVSLCMHSISYANDIPINFANHLSRAETQQTRQLQNILPNLQQKITQVADNVYVASGYDASNVSMIIGNDGYILIDAGKFPANTKKIAKEFRTITDKPLKAVIFTHGHNDHVGGLSSFVTDSKTIETYGAANLGEENDFDELAGHKNFRSYRQNGSKLPMVERIHNGVAPALTFKKSADDKLTKKQPYAPAITYRDLSHSISNAIQKVTIAGIELELIRAGGETADHLLVYYPKQEVLFSGDLIYRSFPNIYSIRGTKYRDANQWITSLNTMLAKEPKVLVMGHTRPFEGKAEVKLALTNYRDAVKHIFTKTIEGMNQGLTPDELVEYAKLPDKLANDPNLAPLYGNPDWSIRGIFSGYLGWFDGNPTNLDPLPAKTEAKKYIEMMGGEKQVAKAARKAIEDNEFKWALQLADKLLAVNKTNQIYKNIKADALILLSDNTLNTLARNYYKTYAQELMQK